MRRSIEDLLEMIEEPNRTPAKRLFAEHETLFRKARGSSYNHQAWEGGYLDHITEVMNIALILYEALDGRRELPFKVSDALLVLYLHDVEKPWKYELRDSKLEYTQGLDTKEKIRAFTQERIASYGFTLTPAHENGLRYVEGEFDHTQRERKQLPLAAFCHMCDVASARIWHDYPKEGDPWS